MKMGEKGLSLIKEFEGYKAWAYLCPAGVWTIGFGTTKNVKKGMTVTPSQAMKLLLGDVAKFESSVNALLGNIKVTQNQFDALVCFAYNVGAGNLQTSTLLKKIKLGDMVGAAAQFSRWNKANGKTLAGLVRRRAAEAELFQTK